MKWGGTWTLKWGRDSSISVTRSWNLYRKEGRLIVQKRTCGVRSLSRMGSYLREGLAFGAQIVHTYSQEGWRSVSSYMLIGRKEVYISTDAGRWVDMTVRTCGSFFFFLNDACFLS